MREWRLSRGLSLSQMGALIHLGKATLSRVEVGKTPYYQDILEAYARVIGCTPADLISRPPGEADELWRVLGEAPAHVRQQVAEVAKVLLKYAGQ
jgi:transcriptional regulator with XRE-family HTH domain